MLFHNCIQLRSNLRKIPIQVKGSDADLVAAHLITVIRLDRFICCCIEQHSGNGVWCFPKRKFLVFDIGENLVQIAGMNCVDVVLSLQCMSVVFCVNDENLAAAGERDIALHYGNLFTDAISFEVLRTFWPLMDLTTALVQKYDVVVTNPPYLGSSRFSPMLDKFVKENYPDVKNDLSMVMYKHALADLAKPNRYTAFITTSSWMFLSGFEKLRKFVDSTAAITSLVDFGTELFDGKVGHNPIVSWVTYSANLDYKMTAVRLVEYCYARRDEKEPEFFNRRNRYTAQQSNFSKIPGSPVAYWVSKNVQCAYRLGEKINSIWC